MSNAKERFLKRTIIDLLRKTDERSLIESYGNQWLTEVMRVVTEPEEVRP